MNWGERIVGFIWDHRWKSLIACLALTGLALAGAAGIGVDNAVEIWFVDNDPTLEAYHQFQKDFGNDEIVFVVLYDEDGVLDLPGWQRIAKASADLANVDGVARVTSLATIPDIRVRRDGIPLSGTYPQPTTEGEAKAGAAEAVADPLLRGYLVSPDGRSTALLVHMAAMDDIDARREAILADVRATLDALGVDYRLAGVGVVYAALNQASTRDSALIVGLSYLVIVLLLWFFFRRLAPLLLSLGIVGAATLWMLGLYGAAGRDINMVTMVMPTLILIVGLSDCVHILHHVESLPKTEGDRRARVVRGVGFMFWPCLFNTLTTVAGFGALALSPMAVVRDLGIFSAIGLLGAFVLAIVGCTWGLAYERCEPRPLGDNLVRRTVERLAGVGIRRPRAVVLTAIAVVVLSGLGIHNLEQDTYSIDFLFENHPVRRDSEFIESHFGPYTPLEFVVSSKDGVLRAEVLEAVEAWQRRAEATDLVGWSRSVTGGVARIEQVVSGGDPATFSVPTDQDRIGADLQIYRTVAAEDLAHYVKPPRHLRVTFGMPMLSARGMDRTIGGLLDLAEMPDGVFITPAGYLPLYVRMMDYIVSTLVWSFGVAAVVIFLLIGLLFRNWRLLMFALVANFIPVLFVLGFMGALGIRLDVATVTIAAIALGLVVDDTVQFLYRLRHEQQLGADTANPQATRSTIRGVGMSMAMTTIVLAAGFSILGLAQVKSIVAFGLITAACLVAALLTDLVLVPALVHVRTPRGA